MKEKQVKPKEGRLEDLSLKKSRALLVGTYSRLKDKPETEKLLDELESLSHTYGITSVYKLAATIREIHPGTFLGKGKLEEIKALILEENCNLVIFDDEISPQQQRNLEKALETIVIDRTELILSVFAKKAQTKEAKIQIDLANYRYQLPRLRRLWTHLGRQRTGGAGGGFLKGEGEKQIEIDRRILKSKIAQLQKELVSVKGHRKTQRGLREKSKIPIFAIIGYTNVGKSTLLRALTDADVLVEDKLFATLDTTTRRFVLPNKQKILLVDTVGFIRKIPHQLVAAFRSTLEEATKADILLHLIDVSNPSAEMQAEETLKVLKELGASSQPIITVMNKIDLCQNREMLFRMRVKYPKTVQISALNKTGFSDLLEKMVQEINLLRKVVRLRVPQGQYSQICEILREGRVLSQEYEENDVLLEVEIPEHLEKKVLPFEEPLKK